VDQVTLSFPASSSSTYSIEASSDMASWTTIETEIAGNGNIINRNYQVNEALRRFGYFRVRRE